MNQSNLDAMPTSSLVKTNEVKEKTTEKSPGLIAHILKPASGLDDFFAQLPPDLEGWANLYLKLQVEGIKAPLTLKALKNDLRKFVAFFLDYHHDADIRKWFPRTSQRFVDHLVELGQKPKTVHRALISIRTFARWVLSVRSDLFSLGDPTNAVKPPTQEAMRPQGLTERQVKRILDAAYHLICQTYPDERTAAVEGTKETWYRKAHRQMRRPFRDFSIIMLLLNGGLRRSEICDLRLDQLQGKHLRQVKCKGNLYRDLLLGEETLLALQGYLKEERPRDAGVLPNSDAFFLPSSSRKHRNQTGNLSPRSINAIVEHIATEANKGVPSEELIKLHPHMFRHTHAYQILKKGRSLPYLQKRLGHQSMNYLALYTQMPESEEKELLDGAEFK